MLNKIKTWLEWRIKAAHYFAAWSLPAYHPDGSPCDISQAPLGWYIPRFIRGLRFGSRGVNRAKRELKRKAETVTQITE